MTVQTLEIFLPNLFNLAGKTLENEHGKLTNDGKASFKMILIFDFNSVPV